MEKTSAPGDERMQRFEQSMAHLNQRMDERFDELEVAIDRLGRRWGIRNEFIFREAIRSLLEDSLPPDHLPRAAPVSPPGCPSLRRPAA